MNDKLGCVFVIGMLVYGFVGIWAGYIGIDHHLGTVWAIGAVIVGFRFRFALPLTIGSFFGAMNVWGWPWYGALVFASPGLVLMALMVPAALATISKKK
jgi:hypothetical protein